MSGPKARSFLVFSGGNDRAVLGFLRAARRCGETASIVARTQNDKIFRTQFRKDVRYTRDSHSLDMDVFSECVARVRESIGQGRLIVLPSSEYLNSFLLRHREDIENHNCEIPLADTSIYELLTSKRSATDLFLSEGFDVPLEYRDPPPLGIPVVAKPRLNISGDDRSLYPHLLIDQNERMAFYADNRRDDYFFQEYVLGESIYLLVYISRNGGITLSASQRNLLQQPRGKSMLFSEATNFHESPMARRMVELLAKKRFWGLAMIELIQTPDRHVFIEVNPRIWGPAQLCLDQRQPLLEAFIGEALYSDPSRFVTRSSGTRSPAAKYFWLGGLADTLASGKRPVWHAKPPGLPNTIFIALGNDVYLRRDSWRCFFHELIQALKLMLFNERTEK